MRNNAANGQLFNLAIKCVSSASMNLQFKIIVTDPKGLDAGLTFYFKADPNPKT